MSTEPVEDREINLELGGGSFQIFLTVDGAGSINSNLHYTEEEWVEEFGASMEDDSDLAEYNRYEGAIDGVESLLLGLAMSGVDVEAEKFKDGVQSALDAIGNLM